MPNEGCMRIDGNKIKEGLMVENVEKEMLQEFMRCSGVGATKKHPCVKASNEQIV